MQIGKKVIIFILGVCIPVVVAASYCLSLWLDDEVDTIRQSAVQKELESIELQLLQELRQLEMIASVYSVPLSAMPTENRIELDAAWRKSALPEKIGLFYLEEHSLRPFSQLHAELDFELNLLSESLLNATQVNSGAYFDVEANMGYMVSVVPIGVQRSVVTVRVLKPDDLSSFGLSGLVTKIEIATGTPRTPLTIDATSQIVDLAIPSLIAAAPVHLEVTFSDSQFSQVFLKYDRLSLAILALVILLQLISYLWLKFGFIAPFHRLTEQLVNINPMAKNYQPLESEGSAELNVLATRINALLARIYRQEMRSNITLESIAEAVIRTDINANVVYLNPNAERLLSVKSDKALGMSLDQLIKTDASLSDELNAFMQSRASQPELSQITLNTDEKRIMERSVTNLRNHKGQVMGLVIVLRDITEEERLKQQLQRRANFDPITSLLNRSAFEDKLTSFSEGADSVAICYLDLEQFKLINDSCGHSAGDRMLAMVAKSINACLSADELLARLGGDEFGLAIKDHSALEVAQLVKKVIARVSMLVMHHSNCHYKVGISVGIALARAPFISVHEMLKDADIACLAAKRKGSNQVHFYDDKDKELSYQRNAPKWAVRIAQAIEHNELILYYQTIKTMKSQHQRHRMEILLRIQEPCGRILPPAQFIAAAERFKLMMDVDKEVIRKAFLWLSLHEDIWDDHCISINLSGNSLGAEGMVEYIAQQQERFAIPSQCICFEITETSAIQNRNRGMEMLMQLRKLGFSLALDDFGSGFASYGYLREMPVDYVKIDGCFVKTLATNAKDYAIVKSIHDVCRVMGIETVAEFVENQEIIDRLESIGINYAQGYAIGRPKALETYLPFAHQQQLPELSVNKPRLTA